VPILLAVSPLRAMRSAPTITRSMPRRLIAIAAAPSTIKVASTPPRSSSKYVSARLATADASRPRTRAGASRALRFDHHTQRGAAAGGRDRSRVAVRQHARALADQFQPGLGNRAIDDALLVVNRFGFIHHVVGSQHAVHRPRQVHRRRPRLAHARGHARKRRVVALARAEQRDSVRPEHADARRPAHRQGRDRVHDLIHRRSPLVPDLVRKRALVEIAQFAVLKDDGFERRPGHDNLAPEAGARAVARQAEQRRRCDRRPVPFVAA